MNILITLPEKDCNKAFFPEKAINDLRKLGNVRFGISRKELTKEAFIDNVKDVDICVTHWSSPEFTDEIVEHAGRLKLIAHAAGSVVGIVSEGVYNKGIKVCSANSIMAKYVAESTMAYIMSALKMIPWYDLNMKNGYFWKKDEDYIQSLYHSKLGLIGMGTVGIYLLELLKPYNIHIKLYDPYVKPEVLKEYPNLETCELDEVLACSDIISIHAALTSETYHMIGRDKLMLIKDNTLLVNTARGAIFEEAALVDELKTGRIYAVLDVYENEPLPLDNPLRKMDNVILLPHLAASSVKEEMTFGIIEEIERYIRNEPLKYEVPYERYCLLKK